MGDRLGVGSPLEEEVVLTPSRRQLRRREAGGKEARGESLQQGVLAGCGLPDPQRGPAQHLLGQPRPQGPEPDQAASQPDGLTNRRMRARMSGGVREGGATPAPTRF